MHADSANTSTIAGITLEYFDRVLSKYPPPPSPSTARYGCRAGRCVLLDGAEGSADPMCDRACAPLAKSEWLAVRRLSTLGEGNTTLKVTLPPGQSTSYIKKGEPLEKNMPANMSHLVHQGQVLALAHPAVIADDTYLLIEATNLTSSLANGDIPDLHPSAPHQIGPTWLYESHVAEEVSTLFS